MTVFPADEVLRAFSTKSGSPYQAVTLKDDFDLLKTMYSDSGYLYAQIDSFSLHPISDGVDIQVNVNEGKQCTVDSVEFVGNASIPNAKLTQILAFGPGSPFVSSAVERGAHSILIEYENSGFPLTKVSVEDVSLAESSGRDGFRFRYRIIEGEQVKVKGLRVEGNTTTRSSVIIREARLHGDEYFSDQLARRVKERLERMQLFLSVSQPEFFMDQKEEGGLLVKVQEGNPNRFDGVIGYVPSPRPGVAGFVTGLVDLQFRNLFGTARKLAARWYREDKNTQEIGLQYYEPWIASYPFNGQIGFFQRVQDSTYVRTRFDFNLTFQLNEDLAFGGVFSRTNVIPSESYGMTVLAESQTTSAGLTLSYDTRNDPVTPLWGLYYHTEYDVGKKEGYGSANFLSSSNSIQRILMDLDYYIEPFGGQVVATEMHIQDFRSDLIELGDLFRLGGASTLRGYREGQFLGSRLVWANLEYRFMVERRSYLYGFLDAGYIVTPDELTIGLLASQQTKLGYGMGIRLDTSLGLIGVSIGFGEGDTFSTAKLHIRLINAF